MFALYIECFGVRHRDKNLNMEHISSIFKAGNYFGNHIEETRFVTFKIF